MKIWFHYFYCGDAGEIHAFFDDKMKLLNYWYADDAQYRGEYMKPLFKLAGVEIRSLPAGWEAKANKKVEKEVQ